MMTVPATEFHRPSPTVGPPGYSGISGTCVTKSSTQWLTTSSATTVAARASPLRHRYSTASTTQDRKSTRLNSSHGYISYAVFCLEKKKKTGTDHHKRP